MHLLLSAIVGWGLSAAFWMHIWLPDPPPDGFNRFLGTSAAGIVGGILGGAIGAASSNPMPAVPIAGAAAGALALTGLLLAATVKGRAGH